MQFTRSGSVQLIAGVIAGVSVIAVACGGDDGTGTTTATDGGGEAGAKKANGDGPCASGGECQSGEWVQLMAGTIAGIGAIVIACVACTMNDARDPACKALGGEAARRGSNATSRGSGVRVRLDRCAVSRAAAPRSLRRNPVAPVLKGQKPKA